MQRHEFLRELHRVFRPRNYLEIGVNDGRSLALSHVPSIGVDPAFRVTSEVKADVQLVRATSDAFFRRKDPLTHLRGGRNPFRKLARKDPALLFADPTLELSFIDGMHLFEFALRDFINVERFSTWSSVIVFDDMLPREVDEAARDRHTKFWAGDVYKMLEVLRDRRPDLVTVPVDTQPTGLLVVFGADPANRVLSEQYDEIIGKYVVDDPQAVPPEILDRSCAVDPERLLGASFWPTLVRSRYLRRGRSAWDSVRPELTAVLP